eukprot:COSAG01_NODE_51581_length_353_cov_2.023622_1_plen_62_part_01
MADVDEGVRPVSRPLSPPPPYSVSLPFARGAPSVPQYSQGTAEGTRRDSVTACARGGDWAGG